MKKFTVLLILSLTIAFIQTSTILSQTLQFQKLDSIVDYGYTKYAYSYNESGQISKEKFYVATDSVKMIFAQVSQIEHNYENGKKVSKVNSYLTNGVLQASKRNMYEYLEGRLSVDREDYLIDNQWKVGRKTDYLYENVQKQLTKVVTSIFSNNVFTPTHQSEYTYDAASNLLQTILGKILNYQNVWEARNKTEFKYDAGNLISQTDFHWNDTTKNWVPTSKKEYIYNSVNADKVTYRELNHNGETFVVAMEKEITLDRTCPSEKLLLPFKSDYPYKVDEEIIVSSQRLSQYYYSPHVGSGLTNPPGNNQLSIWPNPATDFIRIKLPENSDFPAVLYLYDSLGKLVVRKEVTGEEETLSLKFIPEGVYLLQVTSGKKSESIKFIKQ